MNMNINGWDIKWVWGGWLGQCYHVDKYNKLSVQARAISDQAWLIELESDQGIVSSNLSVSFVQTSVDNIFSRFKLE